MATFAVNLSVKIPVGEHAGHNVTIKGKMKN